jgi:NADP-dependent 3-hydroxy acid dehydrogenase YdfG
LTRSGFHTYASICNIEKSKNIIDLANAENFPLQIIHLDVNDDISVKEAIDKIESENDRIDILVNNAGYGLFGSLESLSIDDIKALFETKFFGVIRVAESSSHHEEAKLWWGGGGGSQ